MNILDSEEVKNLLSQYKHMLTPREYEIIDSYLKMDNEHRSIKRISEEFNISSSRVQQLIGNAIRRVRRYQKNKHDVNADRRVDIYNFGLKFKTANALFKAGYYTVEDILSAPRIDIIKINNMGPQGIEDLAEKLNKQGYEFKLSGADYYYYMRNGKLPEE